MNANGRIRHIETGFELAYRTMGHYVMGELYRPDGQHTGLVHSDRCLSDLMTWVETVVAGVLVDGTY